MDMQSESFGWGILGAGGIARVLAATIEKLPGMKVSAVWSRAPAQGATLASALSREPPTLHDSLDKLLKDSRVHAVYIATTHDAHFRLASRCLEAGMPVLCEKPLTTCYADSVALVAIAARRQVFLMEGLWTRFMPIYSHVGEWLRRGEIGCIESVHSSFELEIPYDPALRIYRPDRAGGALLDLGIYNLAMTRWALCQATGQCPGVIQRSLTQTLAPSGVEMNVGGHYIFANGAVAVFKCGFDKQSVNGLSINGSNGSVVIPANFWQAEHAVLTRHGRPGMQLTMPHQINGYEYELEEAMRCIRSGFIESPLMKHAESLALSAMLDDARCCQNRGF